MPTDTNVNSLVINKLTKAQYDDIQSPSETELYLVEESIDTTPTSGSDNPVTSGGVYTALSDKIDKSSTSGLVKNDGTIDTNTYLTSAPVTSVNGQTGAVILSIPDVSTKEDKVDIVDASGTTLSAEVGKYYTLSNVGTLAITLPTIASGTTKVKTVTFYIAAGSTPAVTWTSTHSVYKAKGFQIEANGTYEVSAAWNGIAWVVALFEIEIPT